MVSVSSHEIAVPATGTGNDPFRVRDGEADIVDCGPGIDRVIADPLDALLDPAAREQVVVGAPAAGDDGQEIES
jgi:hypothetical protein